MYFNTFLCLKMYAKFIMQFTTVFVPDLTKIKNNKVLHLIMSYEFPSTGLPVLILMKEKKTFIAAKEFLHYRSFCNKIASSF